MHSEASRIFSSSGLASKWDKLGKVDTHVLLTFCCCRPFDLLPFTCMIQAHTYLHLHLENNIGDAAAYMHDFASFASSLLRFFLVNRLLLTPPPVL